jgi:hypothetical protein
MPIEAVAVINAGLFHAITPTKTLAHLPSPTSTKMEASARTSAKNRRVRRWSGSVLQSIGDIPPSGVEIGKDRLLPPTQAPVAGFEKPLSGLCSMPIREAHQHRDKVIVGQDEKPVLVVAGSDPNRLEADAHSAASLSASSR